MDIRGPLIQLSETVIGAAYEVQNHLGAGFLEKVYERALLEELRLRGVPAQSQVNCPVRYKGIVVGHYCADLLVTSQLIVEVKCVSALANDHLAQCINYLKATGLTLGLMINFQKPKLEGGECFHELLF